MHISTGEELSPILFYWLETTKNTTISFFNTKKIPNLQFPSLLRYTFTNSNIILWAFSIPFTSSTQPFLNNNKKIGLHTTTQNQWNSTDFTVSGSVTRSMNGSEA